MVTSSFTVGAVVILVPLGVFRGVLNATESIMIPTVSDAMVDQMRVQHYSCMGTSIPISPQGRIERASSTLLSTADFGPLMRGIVGLFLPSTEIVLERIAQESAKGIAGSDYAKLVRGVTDGIISSQIALTRDKFTFLGITLSIMVVMGTIVVDRILGEIEKKTNPTIEIIQETKDKTLGHLNAMRKSYTDAVSNTVNISYESLSQMLQAWKGTPRPNDSLSEMKAAEDQKNFLN